LTSLPPQIGQLSSLKALYVDRLEYMITYSRSYKGFWVEIN